MSEEPEAMGVVDRTDDVWELLIIVADLAGGQWPELARAAALDMTAAANVEDQEDSQSTQLLPDILTVFCAEFLTTTELVSRLKELDESPWASGEIDLNPPKLTHETRQIGPS